MNLRVKLLWSFGRLEKVNIGSFLSRLSSRFKSATSMVASRKMLTSADLIMSWCLYQGFVIVKQFLERLKLMFLYPLIILRMGDKKSKVWFSSNASAFSPGVILESIMLSKLV